MMLKSQWILYFLPPPYFAILAKIKYTWQASSKTSPQMGHLITKLKVKSVRSS